MADRSPIGRTDRPHYRPQPPATTSLESQDERTGEQSTADLLDAFGLLAQRGCGGLRWAAPFRHDPIAFLLDTMSDAANLWGSQGELLYRNRAAEVLNVGQSGEVAVEEFAARGRRFERRCMRCCFHGVDYTLELIRELQMEHSNAA